ncbi:MAG: hypothetical protein ABEI52_08550, partial [Halobacteriaceae archaeon]
MPNEPAAVKVGDTYYVATGTYDSRGETNVNDKDVLLWASKNPFTGFRQISKVTDTSGFQDAPGIVHDNGDLWI